MSFRKLPDKISDPGPLLAIMRTCRQAMIQASSTVKPMGTTYHGLSMVVAAIDSLATLFTRRNDYFWAAGGGATDGKRKRVAADADAELNSKDPIE
jgi:hypothetical protein